MKYRRFMLTAALAAALVGTLAFTTNSASAQGPRRDPTKTDVVVVSGAYTACSTTDYAEVTGEALGLSAAALRAALVSGKSLEAIAREQNVSLEDVTKALEAARNAEIDQAVENGLLTEEQAEALKEGISIRSRTGTEIIIPGPRLPRLPGGREFRFPTLTTRFGLEMGISRRNPVRPVIAAADALGMACADLAKALQSGKSVAQVAGEQDVQLQVVIDALLKAYQDALDKDVAEGLIGSAQAEGEAARLIDRVLVEIARPGMWIGGPGGRIRFSWGRPGALGDFFDDLGANLIGEFGESFGEAIEIEPLAP